MKKRSREYDFEGRCGKCGKNLNLELERISYKSLKLTALSCDKHSEESIILWPQRDDIVEVVTNKEWEEVPKMKAEVGKTYRHFKGNDYKVLHIAYDTNTSEELVVYQDLASLKIWVRERRMFEDYLLDIETFRFALKKEQ